MPLSVNSGLGMLVICVEESCFPTFICMLFLSINRSLTFFIMYIYIYLYLKNYIVKIRTITPWSKHMAQSPKGGLIQFFFKNQYMVTVPSTFTHRIHVWYIYLHLLLKTINHDYNGSYGSYGLPAQNYMAKTIRLCLSSVNFQKG